MAIYVTDGVSYANDGYTISEPKPACASLEERIRRQTAYCQIGVTDDGQERPITQMQTISRDIHAALSDDFALYVVAMGRVDVTGLDMVASHPDMLYVAREAELVELFLNLIVPETEEPPCAQQTGPVVTAIAPINAPEWDTGASCTPPPQGVYGYARLSRDDFSVDVPITNNDTGTLAYSIDRGLSAGDYTLSAWVAYNAQGEPDGTRIYDMILDPDTLSLTQSITLTIPANANICDIVAGPDVSLDLAAEVDLCTAAGGAVCASAPISIAQPTLAISPTLGSPGSFISITGSDFPPTITGTLSINGAMISDTLTVDAAGSLRVLLDTTGAETGVYTVTLQPGGGSAAETAYTVNFELASAAPLHEPEPGTSIPVVTIPQEAPVTERRLYLPLVVR